jgi:hypothetical protein
LYKTDLIEVTATETIAVTRPIYVNEVSVQVAMKTPAGIGNNVHRMIAFGLF